MTLSYRSQNGIDIEGGNALCSDTLSDVTITPPRAVNDIKCETRVERSVKRSHDLTKMVIWEKHKTHIREDNCEDGGDIASPLDIANKIIRAKIRWRHGIVRIDIDKVML